MGRVKINPEALKWARIDAGYDYYNLPNKIRPKFKEWESGRLMPTWKQLCDISRYFKRPTAFFFRKNFPKHFNMNLIEYRNLSDGKFQFKSPNLTLAIREAVNKRETFLKLSAEMNYPKINFSKFKSDSSDVSDLAAHIRNVLDVDMDEQKSWLHHKNHKDTAHYNFLNHWKEIIGEQMGVLIFEAPRISLDEMRALCIYFDEHPIILLNSADSPNARIFSIFHEVTHLILGESAICDVGRNNSKEWLCNSVSAEFLMPKEDLLNNSRVKYNSHGEWTDRELSELSNVYGVSRESVLLRLVNLNKASGKSYEAAKNRWDMEFKNKRKSSSGGSPVLNQVKYNGKMYSILLLTAYENGLISGVDFSQGIGLRLKHVEELSRRLFG